MLSLVLVAPPKTRGTIITTACSCSCCSKPKNMNEVVNGLSSYFRFLPPSTYICREEVNFINASAFSLSALFVASTAA
jgi:hypothetical protein